MNKPPKWLERAKETYKFHRIRLLSDDNWSLADTAKALRRSHGGVCEDIKIAKFCKEHESELDRFDYIYEALVHIRKRQKEMDVEEIE